MEEDSGVKAPVTRLRRRLSVEQSDDVKSPGPATPTKKRVGRLAAKPQLELIDEHAANTTPSKRTTRKASAKEIVETAEEKTLTPSRRSTRIKSNTSIVSETTQSYDSPRAKRAARRTSQVGSDSESSVTPVRQTRRTRKDSTSSIEKLEVTLGGKPHITEVIIEEENISVKSDETVKTNDTSPTPRKSPRLKEKRQENKDRKSIDKSNEVIDSNNSHSEDVSKQNQRKNRKSLEHASDLTVNNIEDNPEDHLNISKENHRKDRKSLELTNDVSNKKSDDNNSEDQLNVSKKNRKKDRKSLERTHNVSSENIDGSPSEELLNVSKFNSKKNKRSSEQTSDLANNTINETTDNELNGSQQKERQCSEQINAEIDLNDNPSDDKLNISKQKNKRTSLVQSNETAENKEFLTDKDNIVKDDEKSFLEKKSIIDNTATSKLHQYKERKSLEDTKLLNKSSTEESISKPQEKNLSDSSFLMIKELDKKPKKKFSIMNKSTSALGNTTDLQNKRQRTKSWTVTSLTQDNDGIFLSDNEMMKKKLKKKFSKDLSSQYNHTGSGDNKNDKSIIQHSEKHSLDSSSHTPFKSGKVRISKEFLSPNKSQRTENKPHISETICPQGNKEDILVTTNSEKPNESPAKFFEKAPTALLKSTIYFEDSDVESKGKEPVMQLDGEDQCVPVIDNNLVENNLPIKDNNENNLVVNQHNDGVNNSCEPMDIDETMPNNVSLTEFSDTKLNKSSESNEQKLVSYSPVIDSSLDKSSNKSKRKSSLSNLEKSVTDNKSTLILSQIKDISSTEHNVSKSPRRPHEILSKSVGPADSVKDKNKDNINLSHDYSTSTPLQQKKFSKLGIQLNSSIINTSGIENKKEKLKNVSKKEVSKISAPSESSSEEDSEDESEEVENSSNEKNPYVDDEADVASDDYESGDSRDEDEKQYEDENEIVEKGETLDSEDDVSNDTDYEKDSFVVSSDEEDNDLLSGSGDDLSMSDRELSMTKKSKKKFDERKQKEQKKASREMYAARHSLNESDISKTKKNKKRQQIESSEDSEEEVVAPGKRNKNLRLDSTCDDDIDKSNNSVSKKKSKSKRLSESVCDEITIQEHEISTINNENVAQNNDPLTIQVKLEPKTPMKDLNISTVQINENIEEVQVENNVSIMKTNAGTDPLHVTMMDEENSSMSENSEIMNNYDSVLNELNSASKTKTVKSLDISLNLNKKTKKVVKEPIIDELNLTKTKNKKAAKKDVAKLNKFEVKDIASPGDVDSTSDSIDLQLLFSEDSNDYEDVKDKSSKNSLIKEESVDEFIPLKRTPGKTNILSCKDDGLSESDDIKKKNKKLKSHSTDDLAIDDDQTNGIEIQIIVDTQGTYAETDNSINMSVTTSAKKKKIMSSAVSVSDVVNDDEAPEEVSYQSSKTKKNSRRSSEALNEEAAAQSQDGENSLNLSSNLNSAKKKKKRLSESHIDQESDLAPQLDLNVSTTSVKKQKDLNVSQGFAENGKDLDNTLLKIGSEKKNKKLFKTQGEEDIDTYSQAEVSLNKSPSSAKKKKPKNEAERASLVIEDIDTNASADNSFSTGSAKKPKSKQMYENASSQSEIVAIYFDDSSNRKRKRKSSVTEDTENIYIKDKSNIPNPPNTSNDSLSDGHQHKKRKTSQSECKGAPVPASTQDGAQKKKSKKRKVRDEDDVISVAKIFKETSFDKVHITRLPATVLNQLEDKPKKEVLESKKSSVVSTTSFIVEETRKYRNKPSQFLEESVYLNDIHTEKKQKVNIKKPKVLPFIPTAVTSGNGFTTNFKIDVIPQSVQFVAQSKNVVNFKNEYLYGKKIKRLGTYETYKKHRNSKMTKF